MREISRESPRKFSRESPRRFKGSPTSASSSSSGLPLNIRPCAGCPLSSDAVTPDTEKPAGGHVAPRQTTREPIGDDNDEVRSGPCSGLCRSRDRSGVRRPVLPGRPGIRPHQQLRLRWLSTLESPRYAPRPRPAAGVSAMMSARHQPLRTARQPSQ